MIASERINSQVSSACEKPIAYVDPEGGGRSTIAYEMINIQVSSVCEKPIDSVGPWGQIDDHL